MTPKSPEGDFKSGLRENIHLIKCVDKDKGIINATHL